MAGLRELLAAVLGVGLGILFVVYPAAIVRLHAVGRRPDRTGDYGADTIPSLWRRVVQAIGVGLFAGGCYFAYVALA